VDFFEVSCADNRLSRTDGAKIMIMEKTMRMGCALLLGGFLATTAFGQTSGIPDLARLTPGRTAAENALWIENPLDKQFKKSKKVVVAEIKGPGVITMMHFAYAQDQGGHPLNRDLLLRIYWDGETSPSVECPLVDFFCDPAGTRTVVNTTFVNKRRGFNTYFPMPFRKSAKVELEYQGTIEPGDALWSAMPCYSYVMYRTVDQITADTGYFHASWRQQALKVGLTDYVALEAKGKGKFVGWNVTVRRPGSGDYPVDENEKFYIDGEEKASIEFQGLEDSFGFSWGFPESENSFPMTGYAPFFKGAMAYRFFVQDAISFEKSLKVAIGFGEHEDPGFARDYSKPGNSLQFSTTVYWYQTEPHAPLPPMPSAIERAPAPEQLHWPETTDVPNAAELKARGVKLLMDCGRPEKEVVLAEPGYSAASIQGAAWSDWGGDVYYARSDGKEVKVQLTVPKGIAGTVRIYIIDPDNFEGGRKESVVVAGQTFGPFDHFQRGRWIECPVSAEKNESGKIDVSAVNARTDANAVLSQIEWVEK
jgi:hypothetical protein